MTPEHELVLLLARGKLADRSRQQALRLLGAPLRWDLIVQRVAAEGVYPLFHRNLEHLGFPGVPQGAHEQLRVLSKSNALHSTLMSRELVRLLDWLGEAGIPTIPLKGVALAETLYGDKTLRASVDLDLLVPKAKAVSALQLLRSRGYASEFSSRFFERVLLRHDIECALTREERGYGYSVELHWGVLWGGPSEKRATDDIWKEARPVSVFGAPAHALSLEWQVLYLAAHAARHQWQGLKWLVDIHELCASNPIDWQRVRHKAGHLDWEELLRITLHVCHALFETPIPRELSSGAIPSWVKVFPETDPKKTLFATRLVKPVDKLRHAARALLVPTMAEHRLWRLPSVLGFLYYPFRLLRLGAKWSRLLLYPDARRHIR